MPSSVLEYDQVDFSRIHLMVKVKKGKVSLLRLLEFDLGLEFPEKAPQLSVHEFQSTRSWKLDPILYPYSPRWTPHRMGEELYNHACRELSTLR